MARTTDPNELSRLAIGLSALAARLEPKEAARLRALATATLTHAMAKMPDSDDLSGFTLAPNAVACRLEPPEAVAAAATISHALEQLPKGQQGRAADLSVVLTRADLPGFSRRTALVVAAVGPLAGTGHPVATPALLGRALEPLPCRLSTQDLVELLKQLTCVGPARRVILDQLEHRYRQKFADHWDFVRFAQEQRLGLDFTTPPQRPVAPVAGKSK
jgi:hypothetical protein